jgi:low affinity Fe/Cu permease
VREAGEKGTVDFYFSRDDPMASDDNSKSGSRIFAAAANFISRQSGRPAAFGAATAGVVLWLFLGPYYGYSDTWQLVINTGTTVVTFLMVFLIQNSQNRDNAAIQAKLDELIRSGNGENYYVGLENLTDEEIADLRKKCEARAARQPASFDMSPGGSGVVARGMIAAPINSASHQSELYQPIDSIRPR